MYENTIYDLSAALLHKELENNLRRAQRPEWYYHEFQTISKKPALAALGKMLIWLGAVAYKLAGYKELGRRLQFLTAESN